MTVKCWECKRELGPGEPVWRVKEQGPSYNITATFIVPKCSKCRPEDRSCIMYYSSDDEPREYSLLKHDYLEPVPCEYCGRPVVNEYRRVAGYRLPGPPVWNDEAQKYEWKELRYAIACSWECEHQLTLRRRRQKRAAARAGGACAVCGGPINASRSDAKTCTNACRQKLWRGGRRSSG